MSISDVLGYVVSSLVGIFVFCFISLIAPTIGNSVTQATPMLWSEHMSYPESVPVTAMQPSAERLISSQHNNQVTESLVIHQEAQSVHPYHDRFESILENEMELGICQLT